MNLEQPLLANEGCNLGSINLVKFYEPHTGKLNFHKLGESVRSASAFLDNIIDINRKHPPKAALKRSQR